MNGYDLNFDYSKVGNLDPYSPFYQTNPTIPTNKLYQPSTNSSTGFGFNMPTFQAGLEGLGMLNNILMGRKAMGLARDNFNFTKDMANKNLSNQVGNYNMRLEAGLARNAKQAGKSPDSWQADFERLKART